MGVHVQLQVCAALQALLYCWRLKDTPWEPFPKVFPPTEAAQPWGTTSDKEGQ